MFLLPDFVLVVPSEFMIIATFLLLSIGDAAFLVLTACVVLCVEPTVRKSRLTEERVSYHNREMNAENTTLTENREVSMET